MTRIRSDVAAAVCAPLATPSTVMAAAAAKMAMSYLHVIMLPTASSVVMPRASAFEVAVTPATRVSSVDVPPVSAVVPATVVVYDLATASVVTSVVETHEMATAPAAGLAARLEVRANEVAPTAIGAATVVMVRSFSTGAAVCAPLDESATRRARWRRPRRKWHCRTCT